jgi:hypothetical protein
MIASLAMRMRTFFFGMILAVSAVSTGCGMKKALIPVDSTLRPWTPPEGLEKSPEPAAEPAPAPSPAPTK